MILEIASFFTLFSILDRIITNRGWQNPYYAVHAIHNAGIVAVTAPDIYATFTDLYNLEKYTTNLLAVQLCIALHFYHIALYWQKFRFDDWLHHGLMIGIAMPSALLVQTYTFMGFSLFFTTGLPGGIDYALLFLVRNGYLEKHTEKRINTFLNVWLRSPGCVAMTSLTLATQLSRSMNFIPLCLSLLPALLTFWNGQYFMRQVVEDWAIQS
jgi:hypothetical protein